MAEVTEIISSTTTTNFFSCSTDSDGKITAASSNGLNIPDLEGEYLSNVDLDDYLYANKSIDELSAENSDSAYSLASIQAYFCYTDEELLAQKNIVVSSAIRTEATSTTITSIHAERWTGGFTSGRAQFEEIYENIVTGLNYSGAIMQFMNSSTMSGASRNLGITKATCLGENLIQSANNLVSNVYNFPTAIKNMKWDSIDNIFNSSELLCDFTYSILGDIEEIYSYGTELYDFISNYDYEKTWDSICDSCSETYNSMLENFNSIDSVNISSALMDSISNITIVQELNTEYFQIMKSIQAAWTSIASMRAPTNLAACKKLVGQIRSVIKDLKAVKKSVERAKQDIEDIETTIKNQINATENMMKSMDFMKAFKMISTVAAKFIERPTQYAAKYPNNLGYITSGGHTIEIDNTEGKERAHFKHKSGTDIELEPDGDLHIKTKNNFQSVVAADCNLQTTGNFTVITDGKSEIYSETNKIVGKSNDYISAPNITINGDTLSISSTDNTMISSGASTSLSSTNSTEISSNGPVRISSNIGIELDAPVITVGKTKCSLLSLVSNATIQVKSSTETHSVPVVRFSSSAFTVSSSYIKLKGFINLN